MQRFSLRQFPPLLLALCASAFAEARQVDVDLGEAVPLAQVKIDGRVDEAVWDRAQVIKDLRVLNPNTLAHPQLKTEVRLLTTAKGLHIAYKNEQAKDTQVSRLSSRDSDVSRDTVTVAIDSMGSGNSGYIFELALGDTKVDGTIKPEREISLDWDGPWRGATSSDDTHWYAELYLPWSMFSFPQQLEKKDAQQKFSIYLERKVAYLGETWGWPNLPESGGIFLSRFAPVSSGELPQSSNYAFYPYAAGEHDFLTHDNEANVGFDLFWQPNNSRQIALTVNPDFAQIEADDLVVNLSGSETLLTEKRAFFLERQNIFDVGTNTSTSTFKLLHTRRIGASPEDSALKEPSDILAALKVTGSEGKLNYGFMSALEDDTDAEDVLPEDEGRNFHALRLQLETSLGGNYNDIGFLKTVKNHPENKADVNSIDAHGRFLNDDLSVAVQLVNSHVEKIDGTDVTNANDNAFASLTKYTAESGDTHFWKFESYGKDFDVSDLGFLRRNGYTGLEYGYTRNQPGFRGHKNLKSYIWYLSGFNVDHRLVFATVLGRWTLTTADNQKWELSTGYNPARWEDLRFSKAYKMQDRPYASLLFESDKSRTHYADAKLGVETEGTHHVTQYAEFSYRYLPSERLSIESGLKYRFYNSHLRRLDCVDISDVSKTSCLAAADGEQWKPSIAASYFFSAKQQVKFSLQALTRKDKGVHNYQIGTGGKLIVSDTGVVLSEAGSNQMAVQLKYRQEVAPLSDFFVVYTRNSNITNLFESAEDNLGTAFDKPSKEKLTVKLRLRFSG